MPGNFVITIALALTTLSSSAFAWDHPGHMTTGVIAYNEIERTNPELIEKIGLLFLAHPDVSPFWVAAGEAKGCKSSAYFGPEMGFAKRWFGCSS